MSASLGRHLVLEEQGLGAHALVGLHRIDDVLDIAIPVVDVHQHRQVGHGHDVTHTRSQFAKRDQADVRHAVAHASHRKAADEVRLEAGLLDQERRQRSCAPGNTRGRSVETSERKVFLSRVDMSSPYRRQGSGGRAQVQPLAR